MKNYNKIIISGFLLILLSSCKEEIPVGGPIPLEITIDSTKIGDIVVDDSLGISFHPPLLWDSYDAESSKRSESKRTSRRQMKEKYRLSPKHLFFDYSNNGILNVSEIEIIDSTISVDSTISEYISLISRKYNPEDISFVNYSMDGLLIKHQTIKMKNLCSYKYVFTNLVGKLIQFDYSIRSKSEQTEFPKILSSLGTIKLVK
ncbi:MAG: hypothetical protein KKA84_13130 [Bacteroidetes bacterium]|nr:hypothetical protein [Bacteroidota bacterium]